MDKQTNKQDKNNIVTGGTGDYNKAVGIDNLPYEVFKNGLSHKLVLNLPKVCFDSGNIPSIWCKFIIKPIPKGKSRNPRAPTTYRGISLLCTLGKLYSSSLNLRLCTYLEQNILLHDGQNGFRKNRACIDRLFVLTSIIRNRKLKSENTYAYFVDMKKAYDYLARDSLFYKLGLYGIKGKFLRAIRSLYQNTSSCVQVNDYITERFI